MPTCSSTLKNTAPDCGDALERWRQRRGRRLFGVDHRLDREREDGASIGLARGQQRSSTTTHRDGTI